MDVLLLGPPGAGKGTQGVILAKRLGIPKFATGDLIREAIAKGTPLGQQAKALYDSGALVGDDLIMGIVREELAKPAAAGGTVLDGVVRTIPQAEGVARLLAERNRKIDRVLFFDVSDDEILSRLEKRRSIEGRTDDDPVAVQRRLVAYRTQTAPVLQWFESRGGVTRIPAMGGVEEIAGRVGQAIGL